MTRLNQLFAEQGQSPWLDHLSRSHLRSGELERLVGAGIRGATANPTTLEQAIESSNDYDAQLKSLTRRHIGVEDAYWDLIIDDIVHALHVLRPLYDDTRGNDGFASLELSPRLANNTEGSVISARSLHEQINEPNLLLKIPATPAGIPAIRQMIADGENIKITSIFSLERYEQVIEAYLSGLEARPGDLSGIHSVAAFSLSQVDTEVDRRLGNVGTDAALALQGLAAVAQAKLAYRIFKDKFSERRWETLAERGARTQRPLWAFTSTKNPTYVDTLYVDSLIGPDTINTMSEQTIDAFEDHGRVARTVDQGVGDAAQVFEGLQRVGINAGDVGRTLEQQAVTAFERSYAELLVTLSAKAR